MIFRKFLARPAKFLSLLGYLSSEWVFFRFYYMMFLGKWLNRDPALSPVNNLWICEITLSFKFQSPILDGPNRGSTLRVHSFNENRLRLVP